jgi:hypothetical protein
MLESVRKKMLNPRKNCANGRLVGYQNVSLTPLIAARRCIM